MDRKTALIIRVSDLDNLNPITEIDRVIDAYGYCWFGKYGRPVSSASLGKRSSKVLFIANRMGNKYTFKPFKICDAQRMPPSDRVYPSYYNPIIRRISTWFKLTPHNSGNFSIDDFIVSSTRSPLQEALRNSMSSHFICELISPSDQHLLC